MLVCAVSCVVSVGNLPSRLFDMIGRSSEPGVVLVSGLRQRVLILLSHRIYQLLLQQFSEKHHRAILPAAPGRKQMATLVSEMSPVVGQAHVLQTTHVRSAWWSLTSDIRKRVHALHMQCSGRDLGRSWVDEDLRWLGSDVRWRRSVSGGMLLRDGCFSHVKDADDESTCSLPR